MSNRLKMAEHQAILGLARLNWSYRRIAAELGVDRGTVSRHVRTAVTEPPGVGPPDSNAAIVITGSEVEAKPSADSAVDSNATIPITGSAEGKAPVAAANATIVITGSEGFASASPGRPSRCEPWRAIILQGLERGLTARHLAGFTR